MKVVTSINNFARAKIDHDMMARYDLPVYSSGFDEFRNFISNFKGNAIYRAGFESMLAFEDCWMQEYKFSNQQNYICLFYANKIRFLSYDSNGDFGYVLDGGLNILEVATPYTLAESKQLDFAQNADVMYVTHKDHQPRKLIRTSANSFTFNTFARKDDPFGLTYAATQTITAITQAANAQVTIAAHGRSVGDMIKIATVVGMTQINNYTARVVSIVNTNNFTIDVDTTTFTAYGSGGTSALLLTGDFPALCCFYRGRLYYGASRLKITTIWASEVANYDIFTRPTTVTDTSSLVFTIADISQRIEWLFAGDNSLIAGASDGIVAINGGGVGEPIKADTIEATLTSADGCNPTKPIRKDGLIFYVGQNDRNTYYFQFELLTETFSAKDANFISYDITQNGFSKMRYKKDRNNLIFMLRGDGDLCSLNFNAGENIIGWHEHITDGEFKDICVITDNDGNPQIFALVLRGSTYYIERQAEYIEFVSREDFFTGESDFYKDNLEAIAEDNEAYNRYIAEQLKQCNFLDNSQIYTDLRTATITYDSDAGTITAGGASFVIGDIGKHIVYRTMTGYESGRFEITGYTSATVVEVEVLQKPTANVYADWYLSFSSLSGLTQYNGTTVSIVVDGGYLEDFDVSGGTADLGGQYTYAVVGYKYKGLIKSFSLGFQLQGENTQATMKAISQIGVRALTSAGGKFGSSPYAVERIQELSQNDLNYLPPLPIDGTKYVTYTDDNQRDKYWYLIQDEPLPFTAAGIIMDASYTVTGRG